jgi:hypothetical protein
MAAKKWSGFSMSGLSLVKLVVNLLAVLKDRGINPGKGESCKSFLLPILICGMHL